MFYDYDENEREVELLSRNIEVYKFVNEKMVGKVFIFLALSYDKVIKSNGIVRKRKIY